MHLLKVALAFNGQTIGTNITKQWQHQMIRSNTAYVTSCGCPSPYTFHKRSEISTLQTKLKNTTKTMDVFQILKKIAAVPDEITRHKMEHLIEMEVFDPENPELVSLLSTLPFEDIDLSVFLVKNARADELKWHDGQPTCIFNPSRLKSPNFFER
jgi:hypothetical protein